MANLKIYSEVSGELFVDFKYVHSVQKRQLASIPLEPGEYFIRFSSRNPLLSKEGTVSVTTDCVFSVKKEDLLSNLTETQLNSMILISKRENGVAWIEELLSGLQLSGTYDGIGTFQDGLCPVRKNRLIGFINKKGEEILPCQYDRYESKNSHGLFAVSVAKKWGVINAQGRFIVPAQYDSCEFMGDNYIKVGNGGENMCDWDGGYYYEGGKWGLYDREGIELLECKYTFVAFFGDYLIGGEFGVVGHAKKAQVFNKKGEILFNASSFDSISHSGLSNRLWVEQDGKWCLLTERALPRPYNIFDSVDSFKKGFCQVTIEGKQGIINEDEKFIIPCQFDKIDLSEDFFIVKQADYFGIFNNRGTCIIKPTYKSIHHIKLPFSKDFFICTSNNDCCGVIDSNGIQCIPFAYSEIRGTRNGDLLVVKKDNRYGLINIRGEIITDVIYEAIESSSNGDLLVVKNDNRYGLINIRGEIITDVIYEAIEPSSIGFFAKLNGLWGIWNRQGVSITAFKYYFIGSDFGSDFLSSGLFPVNIGGSTPKESHRLTYFKNVQGGKWGYINSKGEVIPPQFDACCPFNGSYAVVMRNNQIGVIDKAGKTVVPIIFNNCRHLSAQLFKTSLHTCSNRAEFQRRVDKFLEPYGPFGSTNYSLNLSNAVYTIRERFISEFCSTSFYGLHIDDWENRILDEYKYGLYSTESEIVAPIYEEIVFEKDLILIKVKMNGKWGALKETKEVIPPIYDELVYETNTSFFRIKRDGKWGVIDVTGKVVVECENENIVFV